MEKRVLAYLDILGFSESINDSKAEQSIAEIINELSSRSQPRRHEEIENILEVSSFSDCIVISTPQSNNDSTSMQYELIMKVLPPIIYNCLEKGFLTRGAIVYGDIIHENSKVYGKTFVNAVKLEEQVAIYPRIIFCESLINAVNNMWDINSKAYFDQDGIYYINWLKHIGKMDKLSSIRIQIIKGMESSKSMKHYAKWAWMANYFNKSINNKDNEIPKHLKNQDYKFGLKIIDIPTFNYKKQDVINP